MAVSTCAAAGARRTRARTREQTITFKEMPPRATAPFGLIKISGYLRGREHLTFKTGSREEFASGARRAPISAGGRKLAPMAGGSGFAPLEPGTPRAGTTRRRPLP